MKKTTDVDSIMANIKVLFSNSILLGYNYIVLKFLIRFGARSIYCRTQTYTGTITHSNTQLLRLNIK